MHQMLLKAMLADWLASWLAGWLVGLFVGWMKGWIDWSKAAFGLKFEPDSTDYLGYNCIQTFHLGGDISSKIESEI